MRSVEIFTGAGGLAMGLQMAGFEHSALIEWDRYSCANIRRNINNGYKPIEHWNVIESDVRLIDYSSFGTNIRLIAGGPPCQPFSLGGKHQAYNDKRDMFPEAVRAVREVKPHVFIFENVKGLLRKSFATYFNYILLQLMYPDHFRALNENWGRHLTRLEKGHVSNSLGGAKYNVVFRLLNTADYGVPQARHRVIIAGFRNDFEVNWSFPEATHSRNALLYSQWVTGEYWDEHKIAKPRRPDIAKTDKFIIDELKAEYTFLTLPTLRWKTVRDAIGGLPGLNSRRKSSCISNHDFRSGAKTYTGHTGSVLDEPSKTLKAGDHGVPGGENTVVLDDGTIRYYTIRESARLQTFPDDYLFYGSWTESMRQIGNAVPVKFASVIGNSIIHHLKEVG